MIREEEAVNYKKMERQVKKLEYLVLLLSFVSGITMFILYPKMFHIKDVLKAQSYEYTQFRSIVSIPWTLKPLIGYIEDVVFVKGYRIKFWICLSNVMYLSASLIIFFKTTNYTSFLVLDFITSLANAMQDVVGQGLAVVVMNMKKILREREGVKSALPETEDNIFGNFVFIRFLIKAVGSFLGGIFAGKAPIGYFYMVIGVLQVAIICIVLSMYREKAYPISVS